ncbi:MAG: FHA domain-containing protein [Planctomycetota bacterium]|jgi:pSer/pThr/pTyr-binding forkhead associated (FHA) protein
MASILVVSGPSEGAYYPLGERTVVIGRDEGCSVQIVDDLVSRRHAQIQLDRERGIYHALDLASANGTFINDRRIGSDVPLADGDVIRVGDTEVMFSAQDFTDATTAFDHLRERGERSRSTVISKEEGD